MKTRKIAQIILYLRGLAIAKIILDLNQQDSTALAADFEATADTLPWSVQAGNGLNLRVLIPAYRKINREGILAQNVRPK